MYLWKLNIAAIIVGNTSLQRAKEHLLHIVLTVGQMMSGIFRKKKGNK
jgi:hypothetical protein